MKGEELATVIFWRWTLLGYRFLQRVFRAKFRHSDLA